MFLGVRRSVLGYELSELRSSTAFSLAEFLIASVSVLNASPCHTSDLRLKLPHLTSLSWLGTSTWIQGSVWVRESQYRWRAES